MAQPGADQLFIALFRPGQRNLKGPIELSYDIPADIVRYIEGFYNAKRRHSALGYRSPLEFEQAMA